MFKSKYSTLLTIFLIILIVAIVTIILVLGIKTYKNYQNEKDAKKFESIDYSQTDKDNNKEDKKTDDYGDIEADNIIGNNDTDSNTSEDNKTSSNLPKVTFHKGYPAIGNIEIPKTKASYPILLDTSPQALEIAVGVTYPSSPEINQPGNIVIIGHNYRNGKLFSNNKKLVVGDIIKIKGLDGKTLTYTIYEIFETTPTDTAYMSRKTEGRIEVSLSTCTDDGNNRLVILARVEE